MKKRSSLLQRWRCSCNLTSEVVPFEIDSSGLICLSIFSTLVNFGADPINPNYKSDDTLQVMYNRFLLIFFVADIFVVRELENKLTEYDLLQKFERFVAKSAV
jgi:hypothetical protein